MPICLMLAVWARVLQAFNKIVISCSTEKKVIWVWNICLVKFMFILFLLVSNSASQSCPYLNYCYVTMQCHLYHQTANLWRITSCKNKEKMLFISPTLIRRSVSICTAVSWTTFTQRRKAEAQPKQWFSGKLLAVLFFN